MTRLQLVSLTRTYLQESTQVPVSDAILIDLLTQGEETLSDVAEYSAAKFTDTFITNQSEYELAPEILSILSVAWNDTGAHLIAVPGPTSLARMNEELVSWRTDPADRPNRWWVLGDALIVYPKPSATYNATTIELYATIVPPAMTGDASTPTDLPLRFHRTLAKFAAAKWSRIDKENPTAQRMASVWEAEVAADTARLRMFVEQNRTSTDGLGPRVSYSRDSVPVGQLIDPEDRP